LQCFLELLTGEVMPFPYIPQSEVLWGVWLGERPPYHLYHCYRWVFLANTKSRTYWGEGDPVLHQELCSFMGVYTLSSCLHQAFSRPSLSSLYACNILSLRHSQNNRPLRPLWLQGPSILATTQPWGITLQIIKCLATRLKSILSFKGSYYSSFGGRNRNIPHNPNCCKI